MIPQRQLPPLETQHRHPVPPLHFLALPPTYVEPSQSYPSGQPITSSHASEGLAPNIASLAAADFDVDVRTGFLPATRNVERLEGPWEIWEEALEAATGNGVVGEGLRLGGIREKERLWREGVESMPIVDIEQLRASLPLMRRAHVVLSFLLHFYVHTTPPSFPSTPPTIPPSISVPILSISSLLGLPPILTYADTVLWNFRSFDPDSVSSWKSNPPTSCISSFTGTKSEEEFYLVSAKCEIAGAEALRLMRQSLDELFLGDELALKRLTHYLKKLASQIDKIGDITLSAMQTVDPEEFYHLVRPWFKGADSNGPESPGWAYITSTEGSSSGSTSYTSELFSGPSAGQSSLIHAIDIFLTVDHSPSPHPQPQPQATASNLPTPPSSNPSPPSSSQSSQSSSEAPRQIMTDHTPISTSSSSPTTPHPTEATFVQRMLQYMPHPHRSFLLHLSSHPTPLRTLVLEHAVSHPRLTEAYDGALEALKRFREKHMRIVSRFIVQQARRQPSPRIARLLGIEPELEPSDQNQDEGLILTLGPTPTRTPLSSIPPSITSTPVSTRPSTPTPIAIGELRGTGGTPLFRFLKRCRDNTTKAMIGKPSAAGYELRESGSESEGEKK